MTDLPTSLKRLSAFICCLVLVAGPVTFARAQQPRPQCDRPEGSGYWISLRVAGFPTGPGEVVQYAAEPGNFFVTNGQSVLRLTISECRWSTVFELPDTPAAYGFSASTARIVDVVMPQGRSSAVLLVIEETGPQPRPHILRSPDDGRTWQSGDAGLPPAGRPEILRFAPSQPDTAYLGIELGDGNIDLMYASEDGGVSWELRSSPTRWAPDAGITGLAVDDLDPATVWAWGNGGLFRSEDGARTFEEIEELAGDVVGPVDVFRAPGEPARIFAFRPQEDDFLGSQDGGATWERYGSPPQVESVAHGSRRESLLIATGFGIYAFHAPSFSWVRLTTPRPGIVDLTADRQTTRGEFYGRTSSTVEIYQGPSAGRLLIEPQGDPGVDVPLLAAPPDIPPEPDPRLSGGRSRIVLDPGDEKTLRYVLSLPRQRTPLDVFFLVDTSDSMTHTINGLVLGMASIIEALHEAGIDVQFGVGEYRAYPDSLVPRRPEPNFVYRRVRDVGPFSSSLQAALESLEADAGGRFESHLSALLHTATGQGEDVYPPGPSERDVPPGQQANFRAKALRVVIHATDSQFGRDEDRRDRDAVSDFGRLDAPQLPTFAEVIDALKERNILHAGLAVGSGARESRYARSEDGFPTAIGDLSRMASATGALSPSALDCDGDGIIDLAPNDPLVCALTKQELAEGSLVPAIVNLVKAVRNFQEVSLEVQRGRGRVASIDPATYPTIELEARNELDFAVTYSCPSAARRRSARLVDLAARTSQEVLARTSTKVICRVPPEEDPFLPFELFQPLIALLVPPFPPPPPPLTEIASATQSQAQAQFGFAAQKQEQPQLAYVQAEKGVGLQEALADDHSMTSFTRSRGDVAPERTLGAGAVVMAMLYAASSLARRTALRTQHQRRR